MRSLHQSVSAGSNNELRQLAQDEGMRRKLHRLQQTRWYGTWDPGAHSPIAQDCLSRTQRYPGSVLDRDEWGGRWVCGLTPPRPLGLRNEAGFHGCATPWRSSLFFGGTPGKGWGPWAPRLQIRL